MKFPHARILVFSKAPVPGTVKTRLVPLLGMAGAADVYRELLENCLQRICTARLCPVELHCAPDCTHADLQALCGHYRLTPVTQAAGDLGERMAHAFELALRDADVAVLVGSDCPELESGDIEQAIARLYSGSDVILGPALDGGYYLIGLRRPHAELFVDMDWGEADVFRTTMQRVDALGLSPYCLPARRDIDSPADYSAWRPDAR